MTAVPEPKLRTRITGATASLGRTGFPHVTSVTGGTLDIVTGPSQPGAKEPVGLPSNVEFGKGDDRGTLYITIDKSLYSIRLKTRG